MEIKNKKISECYVYSKSAVFFKVVDAIKTAPRIDKNTKEFVEDVALEVKRSKAPSYILKILTSANTVLYKPTTPLARVAKVVCAKDFTEKGTHIKVFIDISNVITKNEATGRYKVQVDVLIAYLVSAKTNMVYYKLENAFTSKSSYMAIASSIYAKLFTNLIDYVGNISVIPGNKQKMRFYAAKFFLINVMQLTNEDKINSIAAKACEAKELEAKAFDVVTNDEDFKTIESFVALVKKIFKLDKLTVSLVIEKWMYLYGPATIMAIEFLPAFITMITDAYCGVYLNNQKSIEKIIGKELVLFGKENIYDNAGIK